jgi:hypothetical protein
VDSALRESFAPITPEPVESDSDGNGDSQRSLNAKLPMRQSLRGGKMISQVSKQKSSKCKVLC